MTTVEMDADCIRDLETRFNEIQQNHVLNQYESHKDKFREHSKTFGDWYINFLKILEIF
jgi:hypothetical protein